MAAVVRVLTSQEWHIFSRVLDDLGSGGIVVSPKDAKAFKLKTGLEVPADEIIEDFDYQGEQMVQIDFLHEHNSYVWNAVLGHLQVVRDCTCGGAMILYSDTNSVPVFECVKCRKRES